MKAKLPLPERTERCGCCGRAEDRDVNAARNLLSLAAGGADRRPARGGCGMSALMSTHPPTAFPECRAGCSGLLPFGAVGCGWCREGG